VKITVRTRSDAEVERCGDRSAIQIHIDERKVFSVCDGEPEDATLSRDYNDCWFIPDLLEKAYNAGKAGEKFELVYEDDDGI